MESFAPLGPGLSGSLFLRAEPVDRGALPRYQNALAKRHEVAGVGALRPRTVIASERIAARRNEPISRRLRLAEVGAFLSCTPRRSTPEPRRRATCKPLPRIASTWDDLLRLRDRLSRTKAVRNPAPFRDVIRQPRRFINRQGRRTVPDCRFFKTKHRRPERRPGNSTSFSRQGSWCLRGGRIT